VKDKESSSLSGQDSQKAKVTMEAIQSPAFLLNHPSGNKNSSKAT
jgi:hypothetical protein